MLLYDLRHAARRLAREPGFTLAVALTLALGVGANVTVFAVVEALLLRPLPYAASERLVTLNHRDDRTGVTKPFNALGDYVDIAARQRSFDAFGAYGSGEATVFGMGDPYRVSVLAATAGALDALGLRPALGRTLRADDTRPGAGPVMLLGYDLWQTRFGGDSAVVGRSVRIQNEDRLVVGVAPPGFRFPPNAETEVIASMTIPVAAPEERRSGWLFAVGRLASGRTLAQAETEITTISRGLEHEFPQSNQASTYFLTPLRDALVGDTKQALVLLFAAVGVVLLIAWVNVANLFLARSLARRREMAVRMALGAAAGRLARQLLLESLLIALVAAGLGLGVTYWAAKALAPLVPAAVALPVDVRLSPAVLGFTLLLAVVTAVGFGGMAGLTLRLERALSVLVVARRASLGAGARRAMSGLVVAEIALAVVLLVGAGLILRTFAGLLAVDPGFRYEQVMTMQLALPADRYAAAEARAGFYRRALESLEAMPQVRDAGAAVVTPLTGNNWTVPFERSDRPVPRGERPPDVGWQLASGGFFRALDIPLLDGRLFDERDTPNTPPVAIVSAAVQRRFFPGEPAVGRTIRLGEQTLEIVGVVGDIRRAALQDEPRADLYFPLEQPVVPEVTLFIRTAGDPAASLDAIEAAIRQVEPGAALAEPRTLADVASESVRTTRLVLSLLGGFAAIALALAAVGIYGVMSYVVRQRTREIGTRMALGARPRDIASLVLRQGAAVAGAGTALGLAVGLVATRALRSILYGVSSTDPTILAGAAALLVATTLAACWLPARRAAAVDPARTLTEE